jgi:hypothetical protein
MAKSSNFTPDYWVLPQNILCAESTIHELLTTVALAPLPLAQKVILVDQYDLWPFLTGSRLTPEFRLFIDIADHLEALHISKIETVVSAEELNGELQLCNHTLTPLVTIPYPNLLFSAAALHHYARPAYREMLFQLFTWGKRISRYRGVTVTWDQAIDRKVWTTNIDTVYLLDCLFQDGVFDRTEIQTAMEVGVGGGAISKTLVTYLPGLRELTITDISPYALVCARRNIIPVLRPGQRLHLYLGKGLRSLTTRVDLLVVNPPYIPQQQPPDVADPYRGTGLIQEILTLGLRYLNPANPHAAIYMGTSSLAAKAVEACCHANPALQIETVGTPREVPLKILQVNEARAWLTFLEQEHGLSRSPERLEADGFEFWHTLSVLKITRPPGR